MPGEVSELRSEVRRPSDREDETSKVRNRVRETEERRDDGRDGTQVTKEHTRLGN